MKVFHIIENTADQQVLEITAPNLETAIDIYLRNCTYEELIEQDTIAEQTCFSFPTEYCFIVRQNAFVVFAEWKSKQGLY